VHVCGCIQCSVVTITSSSLEQVSQSLAESRGRYLVEPRNARSRSTCVNWPTRLDNSKLSEHLSDMFNSNIFLIFSFKIIEIIEKWANLIKICETCQPRQSLVMSVRCCKNSIISHTSTTHTWPCVISPFSKSYIQSIPAIEWDTA